MPNPTATDLSVTSCSMLISPSTRLSIDTREPVTPAQGRLHQHLKDTVHLATASFAG